MVRGFLKQVKNRIGFEADVPSRLKVQAAATIGPLSSMLGPSGRITLASLKWFFQESERSEFINYVQNPLLIGSALNAESIAASNQPEEDTSDHTNALRSNKTQIINSDDKFPKRSGPGASLPYAIYPIMKRSGTESPTGIFTIGRTKENSMIMKDMAISKKHAVIFIHKGSFYIKDCGSTNGTRVNDQPVNKQPVKLGDKAKIQFGNLRFTFMTPASLHDLLST